MIQNVIQKMLRYWTLYPTRFAALPCSFAVVLQIGWGPSGPVSSAPWGRIGGCLLAALSSGASGRRLLPWSPTPVGGCLSLRRLTPRCCPGLVLGWGAPSWCGSMFASSWRDVWNGCRRFAWLALILRLVAWGLRCCCRRFAQFAFIFRQVPGLIFDLNAFLPGKSWSVVWLHFSFRFRAKSDVFLLFSNFLDLIDVPFDFLAFC